MASLATALRASLGPFVLAAATVATGALTGCSSPADAFSSATGEALTTGFGAFRPGAEAKNGKPTDVNLTNAYWMAYSAFALYAGTPQDTETEMKNLSNFVPVTYQSFHDSQTDATAYYARLDNVAILAFKGTDFTDWKQYEILGDIGLTKVDGGSAYSGFVMAFHNLWKEPGTPGAGGADDMRAFVLADEQKANVPLYITGHSLGGAFATLAASAIVHDPAFILDGKPVLQNVYSYGSPRVGTEDFSDEMTTLMHDQGVGFFRFVYDKDPVPGVIPSFPLSHPGRKFASLSDYFSNLADDSLTTHEADDLVWLDASNAANYGEDAQKKLNARWVDSLPSTTEHTAYLTALEAHK